MVGENEQQRSQAVKDWVDFHVGLNRTFRSSREWCRRAGLSPSGLDTLKRGNIPRAATLAALAEAAGEDPANVLALAGFVATDETQLRLNAKERAHVAILRLLEGRDREVIIRAAEGLLRMGGRRHQA